MNMWRRMFFVITCVVIFCFTTGYHKGCYLKPNVIIIMTDDQRWDTLSFMPSVQNELVAKGVTFTNSFVATSQCCPSRATMLKGLYLHNFFMGDSSSPALSFHEAGEDRSTIATWLHGAGYRTGMFGKYMNKYIELAPVIPPGWDVWKVFELEGYYKYTLNEDGLSVRYETPGEDYSTDVLRNMLLDFVAESAAMNRRFFAVYTPFAPHTGECTDIGQSAPCPAVRHKGILSGIDQYDSMSYFEEDMSDKPLWMQALLPITDPVGTQALRIEQLESLLAVDEAVGMIVQRVEELGISDRTIVLFTSDNGWMVGDHNATGKLIGYEESIRVPLVIRYPWMLHNEPREESRMAVNIDLAPTIADLAKIVIPDPVNGTSLKPLLLNQPMTGREDFLLEFLALVWPMPPTYAGVRTPEWKFIHTDPLWGLVEQEEELYDLVNDPYEHNNLLMTDPTNPLYEDKAQELRLRLEELKNE